MEQARIENGFYVQGDLKFKIDPADAHKTFDAVAALSSADRHKLAVLNDIPTENANKQALTNILKSTVQNVWFINKLGTLPAEVMQGHTARLIRYRSELNVPASAVDYLSRKTRAASKTRPTLKFIIDEQKYEADFKNWRGQRYLVVKTMIDLGAKQGTEGKSIRDIFDNTKETRETPAPTRNAVGQIVNALVTAGIATCLNPQDAKKKPEKKAPASAPTPAPEPTKVVTVGNKGNKKKH